MALHPHTKRLLESLSAAVCLLVVGCTQPLTEQPQLTDRDGTGRVEQLLRMGERSMAGGDAATASGLFSQAVSFDGGNLAAARGLGEALLQLGSTQEASEAFARALTLDSTDYDATLGYAKAMIALGRAEAAIEHMDPMVAREPNDPVVLNLAGVAYDLSAEHETASEFYRRGLEIDPGSVRLRNNLGLSLALAGETVQAIELLKPLIGEQSGSDRARQNLALAYGLGGDVTAAARLSRLDLDEKDVDNNLAYMQLLRSLPPSIERTAPLRPAVPPTAMIDAPSDGAENLVIGLALDGEDLRLGLSPVGNWVVNLGRYDNATAADRGWAEVRREHGATMAGLSRLGGAGDGPQPLLVGPIVNARIAQDLCETLEMQNQSCKPIKL